ncbi:hypothetical protein OH77DRAFT_1454530 [Trametes cingulata]|nr:hypothetical protein OH77DRAFT_1454530 [Trametes cingulata]
MNVFGFFSRKPQQPPETVPLPPSPSASTANLSPSAKPQKNVQLRTPSPSIDSASAAAAATQPRSTSPATKLARLSVDDPAARQTSPTRRGSVTALTAVAPNPVFVPPEPTVASLTAHISSIPPKVLHAYVLARIPSQPEEALPTLAGFFAELAPPPKLHCVRCHKDYVEVENDDRSCLVPHDDESAEVERVGAAKRANRVPGTVGATFETLWGCCGKIVEGDGDQGPPDGWCYEGKHTTDIKRARFRADSTPQDDKLVSCLRLNCHGIRSQLPRGARTTRKRPRSTNYKEASTDEDAGLSEGGSDSGMDEIVGKTPAGAKRGRGSGGGKGKAKATATAADEMDVDEEHAEAEAESASVAGSARGRGRPPKSKAQTQMAAPSSVAKRRVRMTESTSKVVPGTDGEDDDATSVRSAPVGPTPKRRGRPPKSKPVISDSDREMEVDGGGAAGAQGSPKQRKEKEKPKSGTMRTRSLSRTRAGEASDASVGAGAKPRARARKVKEANAREREREGGAEGEEEKPKKRRKVVET